MSPPWQSSCRGWVQVWFHWHTALYSASAAAVPLSRVRTPYGPQLYTAACSYLSSPAHSTVPGEYYDKDGRVPTLSSPSPCLCLPGGGPQCTVSTQRGHTLGLSHAPVPAPSQVTLTWTMSRVMCSHVNVSRVTRTSAMCLPASMKSPCWHT